MNNPLISCVMPTGGRPEFLPRAIDNFLEQTYTNSELVIMDDSPEPLLLPANNRVRYYHMPRSPRLKIGGKRNAINAMARGEVIAHWDDDDWHVDYYLDAALAMLQNYKAQVTGCRDLLYYSEINHRFYRYHYLGQAEYVVGTSLCYTTAYWDKHRFIDKRCGEDTRFVFQAVRDNVLVSQAGLGQLVARAHSKSSSGTRLGGSQFPEIKAADMPKEFLRTIDWKQR